MESRFTFSVGRGFEPEPDEVAPGPAGSGPGSGRTDSTADRSQTNSFRTEGSSGNQTLIQCSYISAVILRGRVVTNQVALMKNTCKVKIQLTSCRRVGLSSYTVSCMRCFARTNCVGVICARDPLSTDGVERPLGLREVMEAMTSIDEKPEKPRQSPSIINRVIGVGATWFPNRSLVTSTRLAPSP